MGGLSSLLASPPSTPTTPTTPTSPTIPKPPKKRYLQETMGLLEASTTVVPQQYTVQADKEETFGNGPSETSASTTLDFRSSSSSSKSLSMGLSPVNFMSPFTKLRSHAANQLSSLQERKTNSRRASLDSVTNKLKDTKLGNIKESFSKTKGSHSNSAFISIVPSLDPVSKPRDVGGPAKLRVRHHRSMSHNKDDCLGGSEMVCAPSTVIRQHISSKREGDEGLSGVRPHRNLETTIKASQQQIIDRVVDRLCGFTDHHARSPSPPSNSSTDCNNAFLMEKSQPPGTLPTLQSPSKQQITVMSPPLHMTNNSVICSNIVVPKSKGSCVSTLIKSPLTLDDHSIETVSSDKFLCGTENLGCDLNADSSCQYDCKSMNNNVYVSNDIASEICKESRLGNCRPQGCYYSIDNYEANHASEVTGCENTYKVATAVETANWKCDIQSENHVSSAPCLLNSNRVVTSDLCDKLTKTVNMSANYTEPKPTCCESERGFEELSSVFDFSRTSEREENTGSSVLQNENTSKLTGCSMNSCHDNRGVDFMPKLKVGLDSAEQNGLVFPALYNDDNKVRTVTVHGPPGQSTKPEEHLESREGKGLHMTRSYDCAVVKTLASCGSAGSEQEQRTSPLFNESCATNSDSFVSGDGSENVIRDENGRLDRPPKSDADNTFNGVPMAASAGSVKRYDPANYEVKNGEVDIIRAKQSIRCSQNTTSKLSLQKSLEHMMNGTGNVKETSGVTTFDIISAPKNSEERRTSQDSSNENVCVSLRPETLDYSADTTTAKSDSVLKHTNNWTGVSEDESPAAADNPQLLPSPSEIHRRKSSRTCKGQRYREFMSEGRLVLGKRTRRNLGSSSER